MTEISIARLQKYIAQNDYKPELKHEYFFKLSEEVGELSRAMRINATASKTGNFKGTVEEELYDVLYYVLAIANSYNIDVNKWIHLKEKLNDSNYERASADTLIQEDSSINYLESASASSTTFWHNDVDDEVWNNV